MIPISLNFMPAFYHKHLGLTYGEPYYFDPAYRAEVECAELRFLYEVLGRYGVGSRTPEPSPSIFIQPIDVILLTQGAQLQCPEDATLETRGTPWSDLEIGEIEALQAGAAARHPVVERVLSQYRLMQSMYGDRADIFGLRSGSLVIHTPYTTAHQLCGEKLFLLLLEDPQGAQVVLRKVREVTRAVFDRLQAEIGAHPTRIHLGDCSASLLSPRVYREAVLPANLESAAGYAALSYHSCGASTHLLEDFARLPGLAAIELGPGTDLAQAVRLVPRAHLRPLIDPVLMRGSSAEAVATEIETLLAQTAAAPQRTLCAWSFDRETPVENVAAMYEVAAHC